jgi:hypothetical protein
MCHSKYEERYLDFLLDTGVLNFNLNEFFAIKICIENWLKMTILYLFEYFFKINLILSFLDFIGVFVIISFFF